MSEEVVTMAGADAMRERIAAHPWPRGGVAVIRANRGYTLYSRRTGGPVARLRPTGKADTVQVRQGGHRPGPVVAARGLGPAGGLRTPHPAAQSGARFRRPRGLLLDRCLTFKASRNVQTRTQSRTRKFMLDSSILRACVTSAGCWR